MTDLTVLDTAISLAPLIAGILIYIWYNLNFKELAIASARMVLQLVAIGYLLTFLFEYDLPILGLAIMCVMLVTAAFISIRPLRQKSRFLLFASLLALALSGFFNLGWILLAVLKLSPWYQPAVVIPLAGMVFSNGMNALSIGAERYEKEREDESSHAAKAAFNAAMIPQINALLAVGLVSLPGMMTGQILSGTSPLVAVRYQIMVMSMVVGTSAIALAIYFHLCERHNKSPSEPDTKTR
ncbi:putative iron export permease protein FetB [Thalassocella blandensis]|nr:putative iron export permease protein FetB [Thalassocella blandensis]